MADLFDGGMRRCSLDSAHPYRDLVRLRLTHAVPSSNETHTEVEKQQFGEGCCKPTAESNILPINIFCSLMPSPEVNDLLGKSEPPEEEDFGLNAARSRVEARLMTQRSLIVHNNDDKTGFPVDRHCSAAAAADHPSITKSRRRSECITKTKVKPTACTGTMPTIRISPAAAAEASIPGQAIDNISLTTRQWNQRPPLSNGSSASHQRLQQRIDHPTYVDPLCGASPKFQKRLAEMASMELETKRWEKTMRMKRMSVT